MTQTPFEKLLKSKGLRTGFIANKLGMTPFMFWHRRQDPANRFKTKEIETLAEVLGVDEKTVFDAVKFSSLSSQISNKKE
jgi:hypothetical protein